MPLKRLLLLAAVGALLARCSSTGHKEEVATEAEPPPLAKALPAAKLLPLPPAETMISTPKAASFIT